MKGGTSSDPFHHMQAVTDALYWKYIVTKFHIRSTLLCFLLSLCAAAYDTEVKYLCSTTTKSLFYFLSAIVYFFLSNTTPDNRNNNKNKGTILEGLSEETSDLEIDTELWTDKKEDIQDTSSVKKLRPKFLWSDIFQAVTYLSHVSWSVYWDVFTLKFLLVFAQDVHYQNFSLILKEEYSSAPSDIGYIISFQGLVGATSGFLTGWTEKFYKKDKDHALRLSHGFGVLTLSYILLSLAPNLTLFLICLIPHSASSSLLRIVTSQIILQRTEPDQTGSLIGSGQSISSVARLIAPLCSGLAYDIFGFHGTSVLKIAVTATAVTLSSFLSIHRRKHKFM